MKISAFAWTYILRAIGILLLLPVMYPPPFLRVFPGLEDPRVMRVLLWAGVFIFMAGAISYFIIRSVQRKQRDELDDVIENKDADSKH